MAVKVKLIANTSGVVIKPAFATVSNATSTVVIKNMAATISVPGRLDSLQDVISAGEVSGAVPVYNAATDKYVIERLNLSDVDGSLDGGGF